MSYSFRQIHAALQAASGPASAPPSTGLSAERLRALRDAPHLSALWAELRAAAQTARDTPIPPLPFSLFQLFESTGTRREYEQPYFERRRRLIALALAALLDESAAPLTALEDLLWAICDEYTWALPAHLGRPRATPDGRGRQAPPHVVDLFAAETGHALAETLVLLGGRLHPWLVQRVRVEIERRIFEPLFGDPAPLHWETVAMNWAAVCGGAVGMTALLLERDRERQAGMVARCVSALESFLEGFGDDGGSAEGIDYWQYGFGFYVYFAEMLCETTQGRFDLLAGEKIRRIAAFPAQISLERGHYVNFSDGTARVHLHPGLVCRLAARVQAPAPWLERMPSLRDEYRWAHVTRDLLWTDPALFGRATPDGDSYYPDLGWVVARAQVGGVPVAFAAKGGHNAEPHNHNDLGHFLLHAGGESLLADLGAGVYTREYFRAERYESIHTRSLGHSVPLIDGREQQAGPEYRALVERYAPAPDGLLFALDLTRAYAVPSLRRFTRTFRWSRSADAGTAQMVLTDAFAFSTAPGALDEIFISLHAPALTPGQVRWAGARATLTLAYDAERFRATSEQLPSHTREGEPILIHRLLLRATAPQAELTCQCVFTVELLPEKQG